MRLPPSQVAIRVIQDEHDLLKAVTHGMLHLARIVGSNGKAPDLKVFRAMLFYVKEFPEKVHHPKEDRYLFTRLRERTDQLNQLITELEAQHAEGDRLILQLEHALARYELEGAPAFGAFSDMVERFARFYMDHMRLEEERILPAALALLTPEDWDAVNAAFADNNDPLAGSGYKEGLGKLFTLIVNIAPPPIGVGPEA